MGERKVNCRRHTHAQPAQTDHAAGRRDAGRDRAERHLDRRHAHARQPATGRGGDRDAGHGDPDARHRGRDAGQLPRRLAAPPGRPAGSARPWARVTVGRRAAGAGRGRRRWQRHPATRCPRRGRTSSRPSPRAVGGRRRTALPQASTCSRSAASPMASRSCRRCSAGPDAVGSSGASARSRPAAWARRVGQGLQRVGVGCAVRAGQQHPLGAGQVDGGLVQRDVDVGRARVTRRPPARRPRRAGGPPG